MQRSVSRDLWSDLAFGKILQCFFPGIRLIGRYVSCFRKRRVLREGDVKSDERRTICLWFINSLHSLRLLANIPWYREIIHTIREVKEPRYISVHAVCVLFIYLFFFAPVVSATRRYFGIAQHLYATYISTNMSLHLLVIRIRVKNV